MSESLLHSILSKGSLDDVCKYIKECREKKLFNIAIETGKYFLRIFPNNFDIISQLLFCSFEGKNYNLTLHYISQLSDLDFNEDEKKILYSNLALIIPFVKDQNIFYPEDKVKQISERKKKNLPLITFTITTCKRYDLFEKTMNSFLNVCEDIDKIDV